MNYTYAKQIADYLVLNLAEHCQRIEIAGSVRRLKADCGDVELVVIPKPGAPRPEFGQKEIYRSFLELALAGFEGRGLLHKLKGGDRYKQYRLNLEQFGIRSLNDFNLDLFIVRPETWGLQFLIRTGSADFSHKCVTPQKFGGYLPDNCEYLRGETRIRRNGQLLELPEERDVLNLLGLGWVEPARRCL